MSLVWPDYLPEVDGERRFKESRVTPFILLHFYNNLGYSAEMLALEYPSVSLAVIKKFLAFYIENAAAVDAVAAAEAAEKDRLSPASRNIPGRGLSLKRLEEISGDSHRDFLASGMTDEQLAHELENIKYADRSKKMRGITYHK